jgi:tRNA (guanine6-N2)-methyltransferase
MTKKRASSPALPACYALVIPGLEVIAAEEITDSLGADIRKKFNGAVIFRTDDISNRLLHLRTTEDVFLLAWGTDELTYRALDLENIRRWTAHVDWDQLLRIHHGIRPKPKGKPSFRLVTQMHGQHGYRRMDAGKALAKGLAGKLPASWRHVEENASVEVWLTIQGRRALCGLRLSDRSMRHRQYKREHIPASLRPTLAAAMVRLAKPHRGEFILDPMCGAGTILAELGDFWKRTSSGRESEKLRVWGGDVDSRALRSARSNLIRFEAMRLARWDAKHLPLSDHTVDCIISNPPFGVQLKPSEGLRSFYRRVMNELDRVLRPGGRAILLVGDFDALKEAAAGINWKLARQLEIRILGQLSTLALWQKGIARHE